MVSVCRNVSEPTVMVIAEVISIAFAVKEHKTTYKREERDSREMVVEERYVLRCRV